MLSELLKLMISSVDSWNKELFQAFCELELNLMVDSGIRTFSLIEVMLQHSVAY